MDGVSLGGFDAAKRSMQFRAIVGIIKTAGKHFFEDEAVMRAAALAFYSVLSLSPLLVILVSVSGFLGEQAQAALIGKVEETIGLEAGEAIKSIVTYASGNRTAGIISTAVGSFALFFWTTVFFTQFQVSLNRIWGVCPRPGYATWFLLRKRLLSLGMVAVVGVILLASVILTTVLTVLFPGGMNMWVIGNFVVMMVPFTLLFALIFKFLPDVKIAWGDVWVGGLVTATLVAMGRLVIGRYLAYKGIGSAYGAASSLVFLLVWVYYVSMVVLFGAELTRAYALRSGSKVVPLHHAGWISDVKSQKEPPARAEGRAPAKVGPDKTSPELIPPG
jgi:membrane protein